MKKVSMLGLVIGLYCVTSCSSMILIDSSQYFIVDTEPSITEKLDSSGFRIAKVVTVYNPLNVNINLELKCDGLDYRNKTIVLAPHSKQVFKIIGAALDTACQFTWEEK